MKVAKYLESIGLALLLFSFGWQCLEEHLTQMTYESYAYEFEQKLENIWYIIHDEALHSDRYDGSEVSYVNEDSLNHSMRDWEQIQNDFKLLKKQSSFSWIFRISLYFLGSTLIIYAKWPRNNLRKKKNHQTHS